jgi:hypothetical protein
LSNTDTIGATNFISESINTIIIIGARISNWCGVVGFFTLVVYASVSRLSPRERRTISVINAVLSLSSLLLASSSLIVAKRFQIANWDWDYLSEVSTTASRKLSFAILVDQSWVAVGLIVGGVGGYTL